MSSQALQTAQSKASIVSKLEDAIGFIQHAASAQLATLPEHEHRLLLQNVAARAKKGQPDALEATHRLLYHLPYPNHVELADQSVAMAFATAWRTQTRIWTPLSEQEKKPATQLYEENCRLAIKTLGLSEQIHDISFENCAFESNAENILPNLKQDFDGIAAARTQRTPDGLSIVLRTNAADPLWQGSYEPASIKGRFIAQCSFHEVTHIEQTHNQNTVTSGSFYKLMAYQSKVIEGLKQIFRIYRCGLEERQAYLRDHYVAALLGDDKLRAEHDIMKTHIHEQTKFPVVQAATNILLSRIDDGELDHLLPTRQSALKRATSRLLGL